jgi:hypothetical protein
MPVDRRSRPAGNLTATSNDGRVEQRAGDRNRGDGGRPAAPGLTTAVGPIAATPSHNPTLSDRGWA